MTTPQRGGIMKHFALGLMLTLPLTAMAETMPDVELAAKWCDDKGGKYTLPYHIGKSFSKYKNSRGNYCEVPVMKGRFIVGTELYKFSKKVTDYEKETVAVMATRVQRTLDPHKPFKIGEYVTPYPHVEPNGWTEKGF